MAALNARDFARALTRPLPSNVLIHGEELLLVLEALDGLRAAAASQGLVRERLQLDAQFDWRNLHASLATDSLFAERRLVELHLPSGKPGVEGSKALAPLAEHSPLDGTLVLVLPKLERSAMQSAWFKAWEQAAMVRACPKIERAQLPQWLRERLQAQAVEAEPEVLEYLAQRVEGNLLAAKQEIDKLALLHPQGHLTLAGLRDEVAQVARYDVFELSEVWLRGDAPRLTRMLAGLEQEGEAPQLVLWALNDTLRLLSRVQAGLRRGESMANLARQLKLWGERPALLERAARRIPTRKIAQATVLAAHIDRMSKGLISGEVWPAILQLCLLVLRPETEAARLQPLDLPQL